MTPIDFPERHNRRLYTPEQMPENVIVKNTKLNQEFIVNEKSTIKEALEFPGRVLLDL